MGESVFDWRERERESGPKRGIITSLDVLWTCLFVFYPERWKGTKRWRRWWQERRRKKRRLQTEIRRCCPEWASEPFMTQRKRYLSSPKFLEKTINILWANPILKSYTSSIGRYPWGRGGLSLGSVMMMMMILPLFLPSFLLPPFFPLKFSRREIEKNPSFLFPLPQFRLCPRKIHLPLSSLLFLKGSQGGKSLWRKNHMKMEECIRKKFPSFLREYQSK